MPKLFGRVFFLNCHSQLVSSGSETSNIMVSPPAGRMWPEVLVKK